MSLALVISLFKLRLGELLATRLLRAGLSLTVLGLVGGLLGYVYQILMARMLTPAEYALFSAIVALTMFTSSPLGAVNMLLTRSVASFCAHNQLKLLRNMYWRASQWLALAGLILLALLMLWMPTIQTYLKSPTTGPVWIFGILIVLSAVALVNNAFFQGEQRFGWFAGTGIAGVLGKIFFSVILISAGLGVGGALTGILLSVVVIWLIGMLAITRRFHSQVNSGQAATASFPVVKIVPVLIANIAFVSMTQLDMVLVNYYFSPEQAGLYAAASVLGKAVLYLPGGMVIALFPMVAENHAKGHASAQLLMQVVAITASLCGSAALIYWWFGPWLITLLYGQVYNGAGELLRWYGFAILPFTLVMVAEHFLIAKGRVLFAWIFLGIAPLQLLAIYLWHEDLWNVIVILGLCGVVLMLLGFGTLWREYRQGTS